MRLGSDSLQRMPVCETDSNAHRQQEWLLLQAALFLVNMHPSFCDALELANALVSKVKAENGQNSDDLDKLEYHSPTSSDNKSDTCALMESHQSRDKDASTTHCKWQESIYSSLQFWGRIN